MSASLIQAIVSGVITGFIYAMIALSLVIVYKATDVVNFAGGEMLMVGSYFALLGLVFFGLPYVITIPLVLAVSFAMGALFDRVVLVRVLGRSLPGQSVLVAMVIATVGLANVLKGVVRVFPYTEEVQRLPTLMPGPPMFIGPAILTRQDIVIAVVSMLYMLLWWALFNFTLAGKALRATSQNPRAAALCGIPVRTTRMIGWGIAAMSAALAGVLIGPELPLTPDVGSVVTLAFAAAIVGGFQNLPGCVVGGILLGVTQNLVGLYVSSRAISVTPFIVIMLVLILRPQGLFGGPIVAKKV